MAATPKGCAWQPLPPPPPRPPPILCHSHHLNNTKRVRRVWVLHQQRVRLISAATQEGVFSCDSPQGLRLVVNSRTRAEYKKIKVKLALLEASPSTSQTPKTSQSKKKCLVSKTFDWDEDEVLDDEEMTEVKVLMALADDELTMGKNHARNGEWIDIIIRKSRVVV
ncbi:hypothetical protein Tco_1055698 [Tanacetum coccineum]|uniref:Retrovirus-related Pol polyprotein from transposon TNT 1-94 n=1 Tax=Tanacetum coccineum TaxID=301880 RepID=A0ABQ5H1K8_9ASTR